MAIFPELSFESVVQINDKTRLDASTSFVSPDVTIETIEIKPETASIFYDVTQEKFLDWAYDIAGTKTVSVKVTLTGGGGDLTRTFSLVVKSSADDNLFSNDEDLQNHEPDILKWVKDGRSTFKDIHRRSQELILDALHRGGYTTTKNERLVAANVISILEVKEWSTFLTLHIIFKGLSNAVDDVFAQKAKSYFEKSEGSRDSAQLKLDFNKDGELSDGEFYDTRSISVVRR